MVSEEKDVTLADALEALQSDKPEDRKRGHEILKEVLTYNHKDGNLQKLNEKSIHAIFEALFRANSGDRASYIRGTKTSKATSASRLTLGASNLRLTATVFVNRLKKKTVKALVRHIIEALPTSDGRYLDPLSLDYLKALSTVVDHEPHVEHFDGGLWLDVADFCLEGIALPALDDPEAVVVLDGRIQSMTFRNQTSSLWKSSKAESLENIVELLGCLRSLVRVTNAPISSRVQAILPAVVRFLESSPSVTGGHHTAMQTINALLSRIALDAGGLVSQVAFNILSVVRALWSRTKTEHLLADEMFISLLHLQGYITTITEHSKLEKYISEIEALLSVMQNEYCSPREEKRGHLRIADLGFDFNDSQVFDICPMQLPSFHLRRYNMRSERNWAELHFISVFTTLLDVRVPSITNKSYDFELQTEPRKRPRRVSKFDEIVEQINVGTTLSRTCSLQILAFIAHYSLLDTGQLSRALEQLLMATSHQTPEVASWAFIAIASCALQKSSRSPELDTIWARIWLIAIRSISSLPHCRAACNIINVTLTKKCVNFKDVAESLEVILVSSNVNGPALLCDSAVDMWLTICQLKAAEFANATGSGVHEQMLNWLCTKWTTNNFENRPYSDRIRREIRPRRIFDAVLVGLSTQRMTVTPPRFAEVGVVAQAWLTYWKSRHIVSYILLNAEQGGVLAGFEKLEGLPIPRAAHSSQPLTSSGELMLRFLGSEVDTVLTLWRSIQAPNGDMVYVAFSFCLIGLLALKELENQFQMQVVDLRPMFHDLCNFLIGSCFKTHAAQALKITALLDTMSQFLPDISEASGMQALTQIIEALKIPIRRLSGALREYSGEYGSTNSGFRTPIDALDTLPGSQNRLLANIELDRIERHIPAALSNRKSYHTSTRAYISFAAAFLDIEGSEDISAMVPTSFVDYLCSLGSNEFLASGVAIDTIAKSSLHVCPADTENLLVYLANAFLSPYQWSHCDISLCLCLEIMLGTVSLWIDQNFESLAEAGADMYKWFIEATNQGQISSSTIQIAIVDLLYALLGLQSDYGQKMGLPSVRTVMFGLLKNGDIRVQYHIAQRLPMVFASFATNQHDLIFNDVHNSLPENVEWIESICIRLLVYTKIGSECKTLLRRCLYHIFEVSGLVPAAKEHARFGVDCLAKALNISDSRELFRLFAPQLLYTWLDSHPLHSIPYSIFRYNMLKDLLLDVRGETLGQLFMRGSDVQLKELESITGLTIRTMLEQNFALVAAYAFAKDVTSSGPQGGPSHEIETRMKDLLGRELYVRMVDNLLHAIIGFLLLRLEEEGQLEKALTKRKGYEKAMAIVQQIRGLSSPDRVLPSGQQPLFKGKAIAEAIERATRRARETGRKESPNKSTSPKDVRLWTPVRIVAVSRILMDDLRSVFGSFHTCRIIRRLHLVVGLAEENVLNGYPLEMLLHGIRPFTTEEECASDATNLLRYLLQGGKVYLQSRISFVAGLCLPTFIALQNVLTAKQDKTPQISDHEIISLQARAFHSWLSNYLDTYDPQDSSAAKLQTFQTLMDLGRRYNGSVSGLASSTEGEMLLSILLDSRAPARLLTQSSLETCYELLLPQFVAPSCPLEDILGNEKLASDYCVAIWQSMKYSRDSQSYLIWAAQVLGRSFGHDGSLPNDIFTESKLKQMRALCGHSKGMVSSKAAITGFLVDSLHSPNSVMVGLAESSLQDCALEYQGSKQLGVLEDCFPGSIAVFSTMLSGDTKLNRLTKALSITGPDFETCFDSLEHIAFRDWTCILCQALVTLASDDPLLQFIPTILHHSPEAAEIILPYLLHLVLVRNAGEKSHVRQQISEGFQKCFKKLAPATIPHLRMLLNVLLYLRCQQKPVSKDANFYNEWLYLDLKVVAQAAAYCKMLKTALMFIDIVQAPRTMKQGSKVSELAPGMDTILSSIFTSIDEPDSFYGVEQSASIDAIIRRHDFEGKGMESLIFRSAQVDSHSRSTNQAMNRQNSGLIQSMSMLNLNTLVRDLASTRSQTDGDTIVTESLLKAAMRLGQWDLPATFGTSPDSVLYRTFQSIQACHDIKHITQILDTGMLDCLDWSQLQGDDSTTQQSAFQALASLTEVYDIVSSRANSDLLEVVTRLKQRDTWMMTSRLDVVAPILTSRAALTNMLASNENMQNLLHLNAREALSTNIDLELHASRIFRKLDNHSEALLRTTYMVDLIGNAEKQGVIIDGVVKHELAHVLWDLKEILPSIQILREVMNSCQFSHQTIPIGKAEILATLGQRVSYARLEDPRTIVHKYLLTALMELQQTTRGAEAAHAYHEYATYCHNQLINNDNLEEFQRIERFKRQKESEIRDLGEAMTVAKNKSDKLQAEKALRDAQKWLKLDSQEYERIRSDRSDYLSQSLSNYLKTLAADDTFDTDTIKFTALWFKYSDSEAAGPAVRDTINKVPSRKFAPLMNQLTSRLQNEESHFQSTLSSLIQRVCHDHPYHGMYQVSASSRTTGGSDSQGMSRKRGAMAIAGKLQKDQSTSKLWSAIMRANDLYNKLAKYKHDDLKANSKVVLRAIDASRRVERDVPNLRIPPITASIEIREDFDYSTVPIVTMFRPEMTVMGGISTPKVLTVVDSKGEQHRELFKGGSDDLRQDAIMEQVFSQVTELLCQNKSTRQRNLSIRTYKVVPLDANSGAIEFVQPTVSLLDFLMPAHQRYHKDDYNWKTCREKIEKGQDLPQASRVKIYQDVCQRFTPVLRHFFFERFQDPDEWFERRLAYTRSTAAISILGHVLGLGDRHCQNILLDTKTGEVVHIDLGVAFEAGRILPKPETVPFRLTRDIIDGFGVLQTEGVFRRCCEFTLEALRENKDTIVTLLNVLRYDPLYNWSVSPLRAKRLQAEQQQQQQAATEASLAPSVSSKTRRSIAMAEELEEAEEQKRASKKHEEESGEADRALGVVEKKLSGGLSVTAAVNELIQQATDERNLAVLYHGWAAYA